MIFHVRWTLKQGLTKYGGDIDILGYEKGYSIADKRNALDNLLKPVADTIDNLSKYDESLDITALTTSEKTVLKDCLCSGMKAVSLEVLDIKAIKTKKEYAKKKLIERSGEQIGEMRNI